MKTLVTADTIIRSLLAQHPQCREIFNHYGMAGCENHGPEGPEKPVWFFAQNHGVPLDQLINELNSKITE